MLQSIPATPELATEVLNVSEHYPLKPFRLKNPATLQRIMADYPLATLISGTPGHGDFSLNSVSLVPLLAYESPPGDTTLIGHVDANNPQTGTLVPGEEVAFVFRGPDSYASPDIYPDRQLPGWLYVVVKGKGYVSRLIEGSDAIDMLCDASIRFGGAAQQFRLERDAPDFERLLGGIRGFEIEVSEMTGIAKLAQDKGPAHSRLAQNFLQEVDVTDRADFLEAMIEADVEGGRSD